MAERIQPVPAIKLRNARTALGKLYVGTGMGVGLQALFADPLPETIVLPLNWEYSGSGSGSEFTVELSARGTTGTSFFLHLIVEPRPSALAMIQFSQNQVNSMGGGLPRVDWGQNDWVRWSITVGRFEVSYRAAKHVPLLDPFFDRRVLQGLIPPYRVRAIVLGANDLDSLSIAEVRLWEGGLFTSQEDQLEFLGGRRLDGRESKLVGYWKLAEGEGTRLMDSSRFGNHGTLTGGEWLDAARSGLRLECGFEVARQRREELHELCEKVQNLKDEAAGLAQQKVLLEGHILSLQQEQTDIENRKREIEQELASESQALEREFAEWKKLIEDGGRVGLDDFSASVAGEVQQAGEALQRASEALGEGKSAYQLQSVGLEVKMLPVQREGAEDFMVTFPQLDDEQVQPGQLSTLSLSLEPRPPSPPRIEKAVPDLRGYTELVARRLLGRAGFRVDVMDQATEQETEIDRVISQEPGPGTRIGLNKTVTLFLGRASGSLAG
jgi:PASTA domain